MRLFDELSFIFSRFHWLMLGLVCISSQDAQSLSLSLRILLDKWNDVVDSLRSSREITLPFKRTFCQRLIAVCGTFEKNSLCEVTKHIRLVRSRFKCICIIPFHWRAKVFLLIHVNKSGRCSGVTFDGSKPPKLYFFLSCTCYFNTRGQMTVQFW